MKNTKNLTNRVNELAKRYWNEGFEFPVKIISNLNAHGRFSAEIDKEGNIIPCEMELADNLIKNYPQEIIDGVIKHELCHWALLMQGKPNNDDDMEFYLEMKRGGGLFPNEIPRIGFYHTAICKKCGRIIGTEDSKTKCKQRLKGLISNCCAAPLKYGGKRYLNELNCYDIS